jgi:putative membrane protein
MKQILFAAIGASVLCAAASAAQPMLNTATTGKDFANTAASTDRYEREAAKIAQQRARAPAVRELAMMFESAHTKTSTELAAAAEQAGVGRPSDKLNPGQDKMLEGLRKADAADFDKVYLQQQAQVHKDAKGLMDTFAAQGKEAPLKAAAAKTAPLIQDHLERITRLQHSI